MKCLLLAILTYSSSVFAVGHSYDLNIKLSLQGKHVSSPHLIVKEGEKATVTQASKDTTTFIEVIASEPTDSKADAVHLKFTVGSINATGERTVLSTPQMTSKIGESAQISVGKPGKTPADIDLTVIVKRVK